ncbi:small GTP-binding protein [Tritrichomonas foetus]|uniref:Ras-related protein Rab-7b n=1 Tax=Tritrichomonas foetus TaxID=1144522 RepID=A0A1J4K2U3_9EUKA|nr:small GTP-binding protein [Tritrichomonas foetus]|eukprot:OHT04054.1 small GTP-binding protein [Tritrichomonas foetus]
MPAKCCKIIILGDSGVGKTTLIHKFITEEFRADFKATLGADLSTKSFSINNQLVEAQIWDTAGTERFRSMGTAYYRGTDACIFVYDITSRESFEHLNTWRKEMIDLAGIDSPDTFPFVLFANKSDLEDNHQIGFDEANSWAQSKGCPHIAVSAKTGKNVEEGFQRAVAIFLERGKANMMSLQMPSLLKEDKSSKCC